MNRSDRRTLAASVTPWREGLFWASNHDVPDVFNKITLTIYENISETFRLP